MDAQQYRKLMIKRVDALTDVWVEFNPREVEDWIKMNNAVAALVNAVDVEIKEGVAVNG